MVAQQTVRNRRRTNNLWRWRGLFIVASCRAKAAGHRRRFGWLRQWSRILPHHCIIQEHRNPLPGSNPVFFRSPLQYQFSVQVIDRSSLTPRSQDLPLVFEWRIVLRFPSHNASIYAWAIISSRSLKAPIAAIRVLSAQPHVQNPDLSSPYSSTVRAWAVAGDERPPKAI